MLVKRFSCAGDRGSFEVGTGTRGRPPSAASDASGTQSDSLTSGRATPSTKEGTGGDGRFGAELDMGPEPDVSMVLFNRFGPTAMRKRLDLTVLLPPGPMKVSAVDRPPLSIPAIRISDTVPTFPPIFASAASTRARGILAVQNAFGDW